MNNITNLYIKTTKRNYVINIVVSSLLALLNLFIAYSVDNDLKYLYILIFPLLTFSFTFRFMEYILTKKSIFYFILRIEEGKGALMIALSYLFGACMSFSPILTLKNITITTGYFDILIIGLLAFFVGLYGVLFHFGYTQLGVAYMEPYRRTRIQRIAILFQSIILLIFGILFLVMTLLLLISGH